MTYPNYPNVGPTNLRTVGNPFSAPFMWQDAPETPHINDVWPHPALPVIRMAGHGGIEDGRWQDGIVIEQGEPVGIVRDPSTGRQWLVPVTRNHACAIVYSELDVLCGTEDIDNPGNPVTASGTSAAYLPSVLPIGVANHPVIQSFEYTTGHGNPIFPDRHNNYSPAYKPTVADRGTALYPWRRSGPMAVQDADSGEKVVCGIVSALSRTSRPFLTTANLVSSAAGTATAATYTITVAVGNGLQVGETLSFVHAGNPYSLEVVAAAPGAGEFVVGIDEDATAANIKAALDLIIPSADATSAVVANVVTITSVILGAEGNFSGTANTLTDVTIGGAASTNNTTALELTGRTTSDARNLAYEMGFILQVYTNLGQFGYPPSMIHAVTTPGMGLSGRETGGVPSNLRVQGNSPGNENRLPADWREAGALIIRILR